MDTHLHDLSSLLIRNLRYGNWDIKLFNFILNEYGRYVPVTLEEVNLIFCFMEFPQDFWQVGLQYYVEKQPWTEENFLKRLNRVVLDCENRFKFLDELEGCMEGIDKYLEKVEKMKSELNDITLELLKRTDEENVNIGDLEEKIKSLKDEIKRLKKLRKQQEKMEELLDKKDEIIKEIERSKDKHLKKKRKRKH
ncbi:hypothetical protein PL321_05665 [Caloramator sp. mosi_1]|uniref:hypothetical protein n=1 Tax=Caloramator sp. mosi_1 TaxID=3023090 RepID=UPI002360CE44|nr:hypothetical protein [Caloramator sp. mosi_1]WDC85020.1 hypothetical protein PL321_05665 [Caloramator sp. mosi_1]